MFCSNCGTKNDDNALFCAECGTSLKNAADNAAQGNFYTQPQQPVYQQPQQPMYQQYQQPQQAVYQQPRQRAAGNSFMEYPVPADAIVKLPFPSFVLKFIKMGTWTFYFIAMFFAWLSASGMRGGANLFECSFAPGYVKYMIDGFGAVSTFGIFTILIIVAVIALQVVNLFIPKKLPIPQIVLCAAPALITFLYMIVTWIVMASYYGSAGPGFGAWFVFILSSLETAAFILFQKGKSEPLFKA